MKGEKMSKRKQMKKKRRRSSIASGFFSLVLILLTIAILAILILVIMDLFYGVSNGWIDNGEQTTAAAERDRQQGDADRQEETTEKDRGIVLPYDLDGGKLEVTSVFQYSGSNPDCSDEMSDNITSIALVNRSDQYLSLAKLEAVMSDGTVRHFEVACVPAGESVWAFDVDNTGYDLSVVCESISCESVYEGIPPMMQESVSVSADGTTVTVTNLTDTDLTGLTVACHCKFDGVYFGGRVYEYPAEVIPAGQQITVDAADCYLGEAEAVKIDAEK